MNSKNTLISTLLFLSLGISQVGAFTDIENNWYKESIVGLEKQEIINGFDDGKFLPLDTSTRAEILKIIMNTAQKEIYESGTQCFSDVPSTAWYNKYICAGVDQGITKGYDDGRFDPNGKITVLETLAFAARAFNTDLAYLGEGDIWYQKYQAYADQKNIIPKHAYTVNTIISRGQAADIIYKMQKVSSGQEINFNSQGCFDFKGMKSGEYSLNIKGNTRKYLLYVPENVSANIEKGLIVAFHGRTNSNEDVRNYMNLGGGEYSRNGYQNDYIVAYPAGIGNGPYSWNSYENIEFFDAIITEISQNLCINRDAVFSAGHSLGSYMSNKVSCQRGDVIRAMVGVASDGYSGNCSGPVTSLITHLPGDLLTAYSLGERAYKFKSEDNLCNTNTQSRELGDIRGCQQKTSCSLGNTVIFCNSYDVYGGDLHSWPKYGSDDILNFLRNIEEYTE